MNIMDNMDAARFTSANANKFKKQKNGNKSAESKENRTPMVIRNLNNQ